MQLTFKSLARPRRAAKALCEHMAGTRLSEAQEVIARMCGYNSWALLKQATEQNSGQPSPDDEDLSTEDLQARREFQVQQVRGFLRNTLPQAREIVRLTSPTARAPSPAPVKPSSPGALRGTTVYMPSWDTRFYPSYPEVFGLLPEEVTRLRVDFMQPEYGALPEPHLASDVTLSFQNGQTLTWPGVYFWKFLDLTPPELLDASGEILAHNPYAACSCTDFLQRLRGAYHYLFRPATGDLLHEPPPLWIELDLTQGILKRRNPIQLDKETRQAFLDRFSALATQMCESLQPALDQFVRDCLNGPRVELTSVVKGGRGSSVIGNEYVSSSWAGTGHWTLKDLLAEFSPEPLNPQRQGGNKLYWALLDRAMRPQFEATLMVACVNAVHHPEVYAALREQLALPLKGRSSELTKAKRLKQALESIALGKELESRFSTILTEPSMSRTLNSWVSSLKADPARISPTAQMDKILSDYKAIQATREVTS